jgi:hypothetical protein
MSQGKGRWNALIWPPAGLQLLIAELSTARKANSASSSRIQLDRLVAGCEIVEKAAVAPL